MRDRLTIRLTLTIAFAVFTAAPLHAEETVRIVLKSKATIDHDLVTIADIASVFGGTDLQRREIMELDLENLENSQDQIAFVVAEEVKIRALLDGFDREEIIVSGAASTEVTRDRSKENFGKIAEAITSAIIKSTRLPREDIMTRVLSTREPTLISGSAGELDFSLPIDGKQALGRKQLRMGVYQKSELLKFIDVTVDVQVVMESPIARKYIAKGEQFTGDLVSFERTQFTQWPSQDLTRENLPGKFASGNIQAGQTIDSRLIRANSITEQLKKPVEEIKIRDPVIVIADLGRVQIKLSNAVALSSGVKGEMIRVRNEATKKVLTCEVIDSQQVRVVY